MTGNVMTTYISEDVEVVFLRALHEMARTTVSDRESPHNYKTGETTIALHTTAGSPCYRSLCVDSVETVRYYYASVPLVVFVISDYYYDQVVRAEAFTPDVLILRATGQFPVDPLTGSETSVLGASYNRFLLRPVNPNEKFKEDAPKPLNKAAVIGLILARTDLHIGKAWSSYDGFIEDRRRGSKGLQVIREALKRAVTMIDIEALVDRYSQGAGTVVRPSELRHIRETAVDLLVGDTTHDPIIPYRRAGFTVTRIEGGGPFIDTNPYALTPSWSAGLRRPVPTVDYMSLVNDGAICTSRFVAHEYRTAKALNAVIKRVASRFEKGEDNPSFSKLGYRFVLTPQGKPVPNHNGSIWPFKDPCLSIGCHNFELAHLLSIGRQHDLLSMPEA